MWFSGNISEAVALSKQRNSIFVVFVEGEDESSGSLRQILQESSIAQKLSNEEDFLIIKLTSGSENYTHFARIYQFVPVPSIFFIGNNGIPLDIVCSGIDQTTMSDKLDKLIKERRSKPCSSVSSAKSSSQNLIDNEGLKPSTSKQNVTPVSVPPGPSKDVDYEVVCDGDVCVRKPKVQQETAAVSQEDTPKRESLVTPDEGSVSMEEKLERAKELIELKKREKEEKAKEEEKQKELDRRAVGQGVTELKKWQAEQELKEIQEERKREKLENNRARQRVLDQIAQDRAERKARDKPQTVGNAATVVQTPLASPTSAVTGGDTARIQLKMSDGTSHVVTMQHDTTLAELRSYVTTSLGVRGEFSLWIAFPRRELATSDDEMSLRQLGLCPAVALLILTPSGNNMSHQPAVMPIFNRIYFILTSLVQGVFIDPAQSLYRWLMQRFTGQRRGRGGPTHAGSARTNRYRTQTNIHRLGGVGDQNSDDEMNTWNGNSTQQM